ncbi:hypothetical protein UB37_04535 [Photobacterium iliopiscarium]|uniref:Uncharacterized protein n=1 Tax=Photobacterium iliopiscarium TaxID=56192 RepID=A0ABX5GWY2_9GAMM|nr:hypothetical protein [Photobacterium iliopiscarium]KJG24759.1 hypothetical protein UB37_04535 [Photobacterium iliopiscarium]PSW99567.1 hypothetical protein C9J52_01930 [Photobacterium iliopiscarium]
MNNIHYPQSIQSQVTALSSSIDDKAQAIDDTIQRINHASSLEEQTNEQRAGASLTKYICLHPYQYGIGHKKTLSAPTALHLAANGSLSSPDIAHLQVGIALVVTGRDANHFASNIDEIAKIINHPAWIALSTQASAEALLPIEKMQIPREKLAPYWTETRLDFISPRLDCTHVLGSANAHHTVNDMTPTERLINVALHQKHQLAQQKQALMQLKAKFTGQCYALRLTGTTNAMKKQLTDFQTDNQPYASVLILLSNNEQELSLLYEMFAL